MGNRNLFSVIFPPNTEWNLVKPVENLIRILQKRQFDVVGSEK